MFCYEAFREQEPAVNSTARSLLKWFTRRIVQFIAGATRDLAMEENVQNVQAPIDLMEVNWKLFPPR